MHHNLWKGSLLYTCWCCPGRCTFRDLCMYVLKQCIKNILFLFAVCYEQFFILMMKCEGLDVINTGYLRPQWNLQNPTQNHKIPLHTSVYESSDTFWLWHVVQNFLSDFQWKLVKLILLFHSLFIYFLACFSVSGFTCCFTTEALFCSGYYVFYLQDATMTA